MQFCGKSKVADIFDEIEFNFISSPLMDIQRTHTMTSRRMKNIGSARYARAPERHAWVSRSSLFFSRHIHCSRACHAGSGHMVQNPPCWRASNALGHPKQRKCKFVLMKSLCSGCPSGQLALQHGGFCTM